MLVLNLIGIEIIFPMRILNFNGRLVIWHKGLNSDHLSFTLCLIHAAKDEHTRVGFEFSSTLSFYHSILTGFTISVI